MSLDQKVKEHEPIDLKRAIEITDQYLARGSEKFKSDYEAFAATMFGFSKSKSEFIEICINGPEQISCKFEFSNPDATWFQKLGNRTVRHEEELQSRDEVVQKVTEFFSCSGKQTARSHGASSKRSGRSSLGNKPNASVGIRIFTIILFSVLGLFVACSVVQGIYAGEIWWAAGRYSNTRGHWIYRDRNPEAFWIWVIIYAAISTWMIRGSLLELKIARKMLKKRKEITNS